MLTRFQLDAYLTTQAMLISWGPNYQTELDHVSQIIATEVTEAHSAANAEYGQRDAIDMERAITEHTIVTRRLGYIEAAELRSQIAAQPVSLVKSAPATYCSGSALPTRAHPLSYFTTSLRRNNLYLFAIACSKSV